ncbi:uncharacterized protein C8Q71DRAFT_736631 [Rhodofomes roseus]|uniref:F-box domain-containing protein n=1 Tax=Rhodofomes roseus TaxID=34475 RepID=A0ABQ8KSV2_9APHY|nr:uncharacterized protein C8Q71DRAFT_736631 [Rhodofomes roseus]KAH9841377.1 hypothetical protein C8Q71DRAFT_736631 [Rhodofomes roseus]
MDFAYALVTSLQHRLSRPLHPHWFSCAGQKSTAGNFCPSLPLELWELVMDYNGDDLVSLRACSLTCHAWVARARTHLFRRARISTSSPDLQSTTSLLTASPAIAACIRHLTIDFGGADTLADICAPLKRICERFQSVQTLKLTRISMYASLELSLLRTVLPKCTTHLELGKIAVTPQSPLPELISSFPVLRGLSLGDSLVSMHDTATWGAVGPVSARLRAPLRTLHLSLAFTNPSILNYVQWLVSVPNALDLRTLSVAFDYSGTRINAPALLGLLLENLCPPLDTLELAMTRDTDLSVMPFTLERATRLANLRLLVRLSGSWTQDSPSHVRNWVATLLSRVHLPSIRTIHLAVEDPGEESYLFLDWVDDLVDAFSRYDLSGLIHITFECVGSPPETHAKEFMERRLGSLQSKYQFEITTVKTSAAFGSDLMRTF